MSRVSFASAEPAPKSRVMRCEKFLGEVKKVVLFAPLGAVNERTRHERSRRVRTPVGSCDAAHARLAAMVQAERRRTRSGDRSAGP